MTTFRVYANFNDGAGLRPAFKTDYKDRAAADKQVERLIKGKSRCSRVLVIPVRDRNRK